MDLADSVSAQAFIERAAEPAAAQAEAAWRFHADPVLGSRLDILVRGCAAEVALGAALAAQREIDRLELILSGWRRDSELARLNASTEHLASGDLFNVLKRAVHWRSASGGAFDERLGAVTALWRSNAPARPDPAELRSAVDQARDSVLDLQDGSRRIARNADMKIDLDAIAKGYVIDQALAAARRVAQGAQSMMVSIGGDAAFWTDGSVASAWIVGVPQAGESADNAPLAETVSLATGAIASSGHGQRDIIAGGQRFGPILRSDGEPGSERVLATVIAGNATDADALATIALALPPEKSIPLIERTPGAACRIVGACGSVWTSSRWTGEVIPAQFQRPPEPAPKLTPLMDGPQAPAPGAMWPVDWRLELYYDAPKREDREADFRAPYMALWVTDAEGKRVRTLYMVGRQAKWQKDNYIWWGAYREIAEKVIDMRSEPTAPSGRYAVLWDGRDDNRKLVKAGRYTLNLETSRERGQHIYRRLDIDITGQRFEKALPSVAQSGGFLVRFAHPNDIYEQ